MPMEEFESSRILDDAAALFSPLQFAKNLGGVFSDHIIGAGGVPNVVSDPVSTMRYLRGKSEMIKAVGKQRPLIRLQDENLGQIARIGDEINVRTEEVQADTGSATVVIRGNDYLGDFVRNLKRLETDLHLSVDRVPTRPSWKTRWGGKITEITTKRDSKGVHTVELHAISQREHLKNVLIASNPVLPPEVQLPKMFFLPGNCRTICAATLMIQLGRLFFPTWRVISNLFNPGSWLDADLADFNPLSWPQQVAFVNPLLDQSRSTLIAGAWTDFHSSTVDILKDAGVICRSYTYFVGDADNPHPELEALVGEDAADLARPTRNCVIHSFEDKSGYEGPTGTALDGVINLVSSTADDLITDTVVRVDANDDGEVDPLFRKLAMVAPDPPWVVYRDGQHSGIIESEYTQHKGPVKTIMTGSKSPKLVNELQTFGIRYGLSQLQTVVVAGWGASEGGPPIGAGLDNLYQGQLDNTLLAWERFEDPNRALWTGDLAFQEFFEKGGGTAYTISGILTLRQGWYKKRPFRSFKTSIRSGHPYVVDRDFTLGDRIMFEQDSIQYVDQVSAIKYEYDRRRPIRYGISIGDTAKEEDPLLQGMRALQAVYSIIGMVVGEGSIFG